MPDRSSFWHSSVPYFESRKEVFLMCLVFVTFVALFLIFFQPFGVNNYNPTEDISVELVGGVITMSLGMGIVLGLNELVIRDIVLPQISLGNILLWVMWSLLLLSSAAYLIYNLLGGWHDWNFRSYLEFVLNISILSIFPFGIAGFYFYQRNLRRDLFELSVPDQKVSKVVKLTADNGHLVSLSLAQICFLESQDNYVKIWYQDGPQLKHEMIRGTLKRLASDLEDTSLIQCHRAFVVNLDKIERSSGNSHRLILHLKGTDREIPVSRGYTKTIKTKLYN